MNSKVITPNKNILYSYISILDKYEFEYSEDDHWYYCGNPNFNNNWTIYVSATVKKSIKIISIILPILKELNIPFRLVKDDKRCYELNSGGIDFDEVGKFISIHTNSIEQVDKLLKRIIPYTQNYLGAAVPNAFRLDKNIYTFYSTEKIINGPNVNEKQIDFYLPHKKLIPFKEYNPTKKNRKMYGKYYLKMKLLRPGPKGEIFLAYSFKKFAFKPVVVKEGRYGTIEDEFGRDIKDRFIWQRKVLLDIGSQIPTAKYLDEFVQEENFYIVIDYIDGKFFFDVISDLKKDTTWDNTADEIKIKVLDYFLQILNIIQKIHDLGYVHRDIQDGNFIVDDKGIVNIIDFELSYKISTNEPNPPYVLGTFGYMAPEQENSEDPCFESDIYSLGALLVFILTFIHPSKIISKDMAALSNFLNGICKDCTIVNLIIECLDEDPKLRPSIKKIESTIHNSIHLIKSSNKHVS
ncbi:protein kinase [Chitinophaga sp. 30R24]|uniref:protein kinase domain-containing protein n=1 Tax=Chitinophaga sp. 30R24 TaxID=3248838 RepID=UPI003B90E2B4